MCQVLHSKNTLCVFCGLEYVNVKVYHRFKCTRSHRPFSAMRCRHRKQCLYRYAFSVESIKPSDTSIENIPVQGFKFEAHTRFVATTKANHIAVLVLSWPINLSIPDTNDAVHMPQKNERVGYARLINIIAFSVKGNSPIFRAKFQTMSMLWICTVAEWRHYDVAMEEVNLHNNIPHCV